MALTDMVLVGDPHSSPNYDNSRFDLLANYIYAHQPGAILCIGDFADLSSLSSYDRGKKSFEGRRYKKDVDACIDAQERLFAGVARVNEDRKVGRRARYRPRTVMVVGNHEDRISRVTEMAPELDGVVSIDDLMYNRYWSEVIPYKSVGVVEGFAVSHYFPSGVMGRPIGGEHAAASILKHNYMSSIAGHSHLYSEAVRTNIAGQKLLGLVIGCFAHPKMIEGWNANSAHLYWNGIIHLRGVANGWAEDVQRISQQQLKIDYRK